MSNLSHVTTSGAAAPEYTADFNRLVMLSLICGGALSYEQLQGLAPSSEHSANARLWLDKQRVYNLRRRVASDSAFRLALHQRLDRNRLPSSDAIWQEWCDRQAKRFARGQQYLISPPPPAPGRPATWIPVEEWAEKRQRRQEHIHTLMARARQHGSKAQTIRGAFRACLRAIAQRRSVFDRRGICIPLSSTLEREQKLRKTTRGQWKTQQWHRRMECRAASYCKALYLSPRSEWANMSKQEQAIVRRAIITTGIEMRGVPGGYAALELKNNDKVPAVHGSYYYFRWTRWPGGYVPSTRHLVIGAKWLGGLAA